MKRATALKVLAVAFVVAMMAAAFPAAEWILDATRDAPSDAPALGETPGPDAPALPPLPFGPAQAADALPEDPTGLDGPGALFSSSSGAASSLSTGSALLDQVLGSARLMGYDVALPPLPTDQIASSAPLRAAIVEWIAVTGSPVDPQDLAVELAKADALPLALQRDLALLVLSASQASLLQAQALARLTPEQIAWIHTHPEVAADLARGVDSEETRLLASLAALVDTPRSLEATLLLLQAVEATRGSLAQAGASADALADLAAPDLDPATRAVLSLLASARGGLTDAEKIRLAAQLVAAASGLQVPPSLPPTTFGAAVDALLAATGQAVDEAELAAVLARADALPSDLRSALAGPLLAQARAVDAARPGSGVPQAQALLGVLVATADALPILQKHALYWREAPAALRVGQWTPSERAGWTVEHAALLASAGASPVDLVRAGGVLHGLGVLDAQVPDRAFADAFAALAAEAGHVPSGKEKAEAAEVATRLDPAVRDAAARMMSGAAEASRLHRLAFADLTEEERAFLLVEARDLDALYARGTLTSDELARASRAAALAARVDEARLLEAGVVGALAVTQAKEILDGRGAFTTSASGVEPAPTLWQRLLSLLPFGAARAQAPTDGTALPCLDQEAQAFVVFQTECGNDVLLRILLPRGFASFGDADCDPKVCNFAPEENAELLVLTGAASTGLGPQRVQRFLCDNALGGTCSASLVNAYGAPLVHLDLGGSDAYNRPVAMTSVNSTARVSLHLDLSGADAYLDPSGLYDARSPFTRLVGRDMGHPTQGSALFGGVAVLLDGLGDDTYLARTRSQGFGRYGVGVLADLGGSDTYRGDVFTQGASGDGFNAGLGVLLDATGDDRRTAKSGMGYGVGGLMVDLQGRDTYANEHAAFGVPVVKLEAVPGGNLTAFDRRENEAAWIDGPGALNLGLGLDQEATVLGSGDRDGDGWSDFLEFVAGSDPSSPAEGVPDGPGSRAGKLARDSDRDLYPDFVERALSTDPHDGRSYPFGIPVGPTFTEPSGVLDRVSPTDSTRGLGAPEGGDKVLDLRLPLQDAGRVDAPCTGPMLLNVTDPGLDLPSLRQQFEDPRGTGDDIVIETPSTGGQQNHADPPDRVGTAATPPEVEGATRGERCAFLSYDTTSPGQGNASQPALGKPEERRSFRFRLPAGILAVGDAVATKYDVDYFFVVDLGGDDRFNNSAGGALPVETRANAYGGPEGGVGGTLNDPANRKTSTYDHAFLAPSFVLNVDPGPASERVENPGGAPGRDQYVAPASQRDFAHGSLWGVLVDVAGNDLYNAGSGSQGSMGGVLLDLAGTDAYAALNLSQGASLASSPSRNATGLPMGGANPSRDASIRRMVPAMLLDFGAEPDAFTALSHSQGFARGYFNDSAPCQEERCRGASPEALGLLFSQSGRDSYDARALRGVHSQGVGTQLGVGLLFDGDGDDSYLASNAISHGATVSQTTPRGQTPAKAEPPGGGVLVDAGGKDEYRVGAAARPDRENNLTLTRAPILVANENATLHADPGVHLDADADDPAALLNALAGNGNSGRSAVSPDGAKGFLVHIPTARLAIGSSSGTTYSGADYAFVVDLGGANRYEHSAGGFVPAVLASARPATSLFGQEHPSLNLYPVSLLLDAGDGASTYLSPRGFSQGAGFFGVGVLVDNGGDDSFEVLPQRLPALNQSWLTSPPSVDGSVGEGEWVKALRRDLVFTSVNDSRVTLPFTLRIGNDADNLYLALQGTTQSATAEERRGDRFILALDRGASRITSARESGLVQTYLDEVVMGPGFDGCDVQDRHWEDMQDVMDAVTPRPDLKASCFTSEGGQVAFEIQKPLREAFPKDLGDLNLPYDPVVGWTDFKRLGLHLEFIEKGTGTTYVWPPGTTLRDGEQGFRANANLSDEMAAWAATSLANLGNATAEPLLTRAPAFSQGAGLAGVGVLAALGAHSSDARLVASDRAQGYGAFGGLGLLVDAGGSDAYEADQWVQGASETQGLGLFVEAEGNERYASAGHSLGIGGPDATAGALFLDLYGYDFYSHPRAAADLTVTRADLATAAPAGNERAWQQGNGLGADYTLTSALRKAVAGAIESRQFGAERVKLRITRTTAGGACTDVAVDDHADYPRPVVDGLVCLKADVRLDQGQDQSDPLARGADPLVGVDSVDFLLDGVRFARGELQGGNARNPGPVTTWVAKLNGSDLGDGVRKLTALATFRLEQQDKGVVLFYDDIDPLDDRNPAVRSVYVNNDPRLRIDLTPGFSGAADAAFSPDASAAQPFLRVDYAVSRDAAEDRLEIAQGWKAPPRLSNLPCDQPDGRLCNVLPLYFVRQPGNEWGTTPRGSPADRQTKTENSRGIAPFEQFSEPLRAPLEIMKKGSFRVALPDHATTLPIPADYKTRITLVLRDANDAPYLVDGKPVVLHDGVFVNRREPIPIETAYGLFAALRDPGRTAAQQIDSAGKTLQQNPLALLVQAAIGPCRSGGAVALPAPVAPIYCEQLDGSPGAGSTVSRPCLQGSALESLRPRYSALLCDPTLAENLGQAAEDNEVEVLTTAANNTGTALREASRSLTPAPVTNVNWTDYHFDVDASLLQDNGDTVVIPAGARLYLQIRSETELFGDTGGALTQTYSDVVDAYLAAAQDAKETSPVPLSREIFGVPIDPLGEIGTLLVTRKSDLANTEKGLSSLTVVPFSYFSYMGGGEDQARLEIRTPAEATTRVEAIVETGSGTKVVDLAPAAMLQGDVEGSPTRDGKTVVEGGVVRWLPEDGERFTQRNATFDGRAGGALVPDGLYRVRVRATDSSGRGDNETATFLLDRTAPKSKVTTRGFAGAAYVENNLIPVTWTAEESGSGLRRVAVYGRAGGDPATAAFRDPAGWKPLGVFPASVVSSTFTLDSATDTYFFVSVAEDRVGNVERAVKQADPFTAGLRAKLNASDYHRVVVDQTRPTLLVPADAIQGARVMDHRGATTPFVKAGTPVAFRACAADERAQGIDKVLLVLDQVNLTTNDVLSRSFDATVAGSCEDGQTLYEYTGWGGVNADKTRFPDGVWAASFEAYDNAGNRIQVGLGTLVLDSEAPTLRLHLPVYPIGQSALKPGDLLGVRVEATDPYGVDERGIVFDAHALNRTGRLSARPVRVDGVLVYEANLRVDVPVENGPYAITVLVPDNAGNVEVAQVHAAVDFRKFTIDPASVRVTNLTHESLVLRWNTSENTTGQVKFGAGPLDLRQRSVLVQNLTKEHAVKVEGLAPSTRYHLRALSANAGGLANESDVVEVVTRTALFLEAVSPRPGAALSGEVPLVFHGGLLSRDEPVTYTLEAQPRPGADWTFVTTMTREGENHTLLFNSSRWLDGGAYRLKVAAESGKDRAEVVFGPFLLDNTPPAVTLLSPLVATNDTTPRVLAEAYDDLAGLGAAPATLLLDGEPVVGAIEVEKLADRVRLAYQVPSALKPGPHAFELRVADKAGALAVEPWRVVVDGDAPEVVVNPLRFAPGTTAARQGGTVTLNLTLLDASGISGVTVDVHRLAATRELRLARVAGTDFFTGTVAVTADEPTATFRVPVTAVDLAGNVRLAGVDVPVDNDPPRISGVSPGEPGHKDLVLAVPLASEPVTLRGVATSPGSPTVTAATIEPSTAPTLAFAGLLPSRSYSYTLTVVDGAGNAADFIGTFRTKDDVVKPGATRDLVVTDLLNGTLHLAWDEATDDVGVSHYRVYRSDDGATFVPIAEVLTTQHHDAGLPLEKAFHYQVAAVDHGSNEGAPTERVRATATVPPRLSAAVASPTVGTPSTTFRYEVTYVSPGGKAPQYVHVLLDGMPQRMARVDAEGRSSPQETADQDVPQNVAGAFLDGVTYAYETRLAPHKRDHPHTYAFEASDGRHVARFPEDGSLLRGPLVSGDLASGEDAGGFAAFAQRVPFAGLAGSAFALLLAGAAVALLVRKKKEGPK